MLSREKSDITCEEIEELWGHARVFSNHLNRHGTLCELFQKTIGRIKEFDLLDTFRGTLLLCEHDEDFTIDLQHTSLFLPDYVAKKFIESNANMHEMVDKLTDILSDAGVNIATEMVKSYHKVMNVRGGDDD